MTYDRARHHRQSLRWREHAYATGGTYFVTICTFQRTPLFGNVVDGEMLVNQLGRLVENEWVATERARPSVKIDVFALMPDHLHGLIHLEEPTTTGDHIGACRTESRMSSAPPFRAPRSLSSTISGFKGAAMRAVNIVRSTPGAQVWQRGFYERVVRDQSEFDRIADYIVSNPSRWRSDGHS